MAEVRLWDDLVCCNNPDSYLAEAQPASVPWITDDPVSGASVIDATYSARPLTDFAPFAEVFRDVFGMGEEAIADVIGRRRGYFSAYLYMGASEGWSLWDGEFYDALFKARLPGFRITKVKHKGWYDVGPGARVLSLALEGAIGPSGLRPPAPLFAPREPLALRWKAATAGLRLVVGPYTVERVRDD